MNLVAENTVSINSGHHGEHFYPDHFSFDYIHTYSDFSGIVDSIEFFGNGSSCQPQNLRRTLFSGGVPAEFC